MSERWRVIGSREPWAVRVSSTGDGYVIHLYLGDVKVVLPALEAHKLGSALQAASGIDTTLDIGDVMGGSDER